MGKKKFLYILTKSDLGGVSKYLLEIVIHLPKNIEPYFIMSTPGYLSEELEKLGYKENIFFVPMTNSMINLSLHIKSNLETLKIVHKIKPDIIHCNSMTGGIVGRVCGSLAKVPVIFTAHGWTFSGGYLKLKLLFYEILEIILSFLTKKIICVSEYDRQIALKIMPFCKNKIVTIHNGISDIEEKYRKKEFSKDKLKVVMITRFSWPKNPYDLINVISDLNNEGLNIEFDLYGYGYEEQKVKNLIKSLKNKNISLKSKIEHPEYILKDYDVYALISDKEGLPIGIIEALRAGLPIIVSDVGGCKELVKSNGYIVKIKSINDLKRALNNLYNNKESLYKLGANSRLLYETKFNSNKMITNTKKIYEEVLNEYETST